jgi:hypothetical protein
MIVTNLNPVFTIEIHLLILIYSMQRVFFSFFHHHSDNAEFDEKQDIYIKPKLLTNCKGENNNFTGKKPGKTPSY